MSTDMQADHEKIIVKGKCRCLSAWVEFTVMYVKEGVSPVLVLCLLQESPEHVVHGAV